MLLRSYTAGIFRLECNLTFQSLLYIAHLDQDISEVLPYLNVVLGGLEYLKAPPAVTFKTQGKLITVHPRKIAVNTLKDNKEANKILEWLKREINEAWDKRKEIGPCYEGAPKPKILEILKLLPMTNCRERCEPTCVVFATRVAEGVKGAEDCPPLIEEGRIKFQEYMSQFQLEM